MNIFRIVAWVLVSLGIAFLGADGVSTLEQGTPVLRTTADILQLLGLEVQSNPEATGALSSVGNFFLNSPTWALIGIIGIIMSLLFRPLD